MFLLSRLPLPAGRATWPRLPPCESQGDAGRREKSKEGPPAPATSAAMFLQPLLSLQAFRGGQMIAVQQAHEGGQ